jgi:hypothetical protein
VELLYISIVTECVCPPPCVLHNISLGRRRSVQSTCNSLREDEGVPIPFFAHGDVLFLLLHELKTSYGFLQRAAVGNVGEHRGRRWN